MNALQGIWARALEEYEEFAAAGPASNEPEHLFCQGYVFGVAFGLALSTVRPDLVKKFVPQFRRRKWLDEHTVSQPAPDGPVTRPINRAALILRPKEPFFDWARGLADAEDELPMAAELASVYVAELDEEEPTEEIVQRHFAAMFDEELEGWHPVHEDWPEPRTLAQFNDWFDVQVVDLVFDLSGGPIDHA